MDNKKESYDIITPEIISPLGKRKPSDTGMTSVSIRHGKDETSEAFHTSDVTHSLSNPSVLEPEVTEKILEGITTEDDFSGNILTPDGTAGPSQANVKKNDARISGSILADLRSLALMFYRKQADENKNSADVLPSELNYLVLAIKNDSPHLVEVLLDKYTAQKIYNALLYCINLGRDHITKIFLDHPKYQSVRQVTELIKSGVLQPAITAHLEQGIEEESDESVLAADVTPLMLAAQRNQFEVVQRLLDMGERIDEPHSTACDCRTCEHKGLDELREAKTKLNTYKALASDSYIVLASDDPVFEAFELAAKLKDLAVEEKHFKAEYLSLADQIGDLSRRLLDRVRDGRELDILLNETSGSGMSSYDNLARLHLAIKHGEKKFVSHPGCQKKLASLWLGDLNPDWISTPGRSVLFVFILCLVYPFAALSYWIYPYNKIGRFLQIPLVKFTASTISYFFFVCLVIGYGSIEKPAPSGTLCEYSDPIGQFCVQYMNNVVDPYINGTSTFVRYHDVGVGTYILGIWLIGLIWECTKRLYKERYAYFTENIYNVLDFVMLWLFIFSFVFKFVVIGLVNRSLSYYSDGESWVKLANRDKEAVSRVYWLNADRSVWVTYDLTLLSEAIFAVASLLAVSKLTYVCTISERIGPLIISLAKMIEDMLAFMFVFVFIMTAFVVGFYNLFSYFYMTQEVIGLQNEDKVSSFSSIEDIVKECFWSIFGFVEMTDGKFYTHQKGIVTSVTGHVMFAFYNWMMVIILINMLIAMMSRSYEIIAETEDTEWKFARTKLFLQYIREGSTLPPPLNLVPTWKSVYLIHRNCADIWCRRCAGRPVVDRSRDKKAKGRKNQSKEADLPHTHPDISGQRLNSTMNSLSSRRSERLKYLVTNTTIANRIKDMKTRSRKPRPQYQQVIGEIRKRFVQLYRKGKHGEENAVFDDIDQLKQDMSTLRQQLTSNFHRQEKERAKMAEMLADIISGLTSTRQLFIKQHEQLREDQTEQTAAVSGQLSDVDQRLADFQNQVVHLFGEFQRDFQGSSKINSVSLEIIKDAVYRLCADVSVLRGRGTLTRDILIGQTGDDVTNTGHSRAYVSVENPEQSMTSLIGSDDVNMTRNCGPVTVTTRTLILEN